jgi:pimeloyl-ACP methyl ester carboxylesterase
MNASASAVSEPVAERFALSFRDGEIAGWRFANPAAPRLLFCHANGFCASAYNKMLAMVSARFDVFAIDLRGHGRTSLPADPARLRDWRIYGEDIAALLDHSSLPGLGPWVLAGHSCGAISATLAAKGRSDVAGLVLIEPVVPPAWLPIAASAPFWPALAGRWPLVRGAKARRRFWPTRAAAVESYARKALFAAWAPGTLGDYLEDGLAEVEGGVALACAPEWEAATFSAQAHDFWGALRGATAPVRVLGADHPSSTLSRGARRRLERRGVEVRLHAGVSHLLPMEDPAAAAAFILESRP